MRSCIGDVEFLAGPGNRDPIGEETGFDRRISSGRERTALLIDLKREEGILRRTGDEEKTVVRADR